MAIFKRGERGRHVADEDRVDGDQVYEDDYGYGEGYDYPLGDAVHSEFGGPFDEDEAPEDELARLDLGSVRLPLPAESQVQVEMDPNGPLRAVHVLTPNGRFTVSAYAAPKSGELWPEISRELAEQLHGDGARVRKENGEWGTELVAFVNDVLLRFVGVDGPRWMLRAVSAGPKETSAKAAEELRDIVRNTVVVRGQQPMPVRTPLPLSLPDQIAQHIEHSKAGGA
ncbi:MAG TPA: DUF3710 domain-containing protein [Pseudonocardiaceae bacterium]|nr:DUF3710 domain-containing protein [Pseudonocardiaceae bacterium]